MLYAPSGEAKEDWLRDIQKAIDGDFPQEQKDKELAKQGQQLTRKRDDSDGVKKVPKKKKKAAESEESASNEDSGQEEPVVKSKPKDGEPSRKKKGTKSRKEKKEPKQPETSGLLLDLLGPSSSNPSMGVGATPFPGGAGDNPFLSAGLAGANPFGPTSSGNIYSSNPGMSTGVGVGLGVGGVGGMGGVTSPGVGAGSYGAGIYGSTGGVTSPFAPNPGVGSFGSTGGYGSPVYSTGSNGGALGSGAGAGNPFAVSGAGTSAFTSGAGVGGNPFLAGGGSYGSGLGAGSVNFGVSAGMSANPGSNNSLALFAGTGSAGAATGNPFATPTPASGANPFMSGGGTGYF